MRIRNDLIPFIPRYDADFDGDTAPYMWYGIASVAGSDEPWRSAPLGSLYFDMVRRVWQAKTGGGTTSADWSAVGRLAQNTIVVGRWGTYATVSAALAAITDATVSNQYLLIIADQIAETAPITWKNHVHAYWMPGASVTVTTTATGHAISLSSLTNVVLASDDPTAPHIVRAGTLGGASHALQTSACTAGVRLTGIYAANQTTGVGGCHGIFNISGSTPTMNSCTGMGGNGGTSCHGIYNLTATPSSMTNCTGIGGNGSTSCHGIFNSTASPSMTNCTGIGGNGGSTCYGIVNASSAAPSMTNCTGMGGNNGASCHGIYNLTATPSMTNCTGIGGNNGSGCHGIFNSTATPSMTNCTGIGGNGGTSCYGIANASSSAPTMIQCIGIGGGALGYTFTATVAASSRLEDTIAPGFSRPYRLVAVFINVTAAAAGGVTLTLRTASGGGGSALTGAIAVDSTGVKTALITGYHVLTSGSPIYARLSATDSTLAYTITYVYTTESTTCYGLHQDTDATTWITNCAFLSNGTSNAAFVTNNGILRSRFDGGIVVSGLNTAGRPIAFNCQSSWNPGQVYNMVLDGGSTNLTAAAGTANGSNIEV